MGQIIIQDYTPRKPVTMIGEQAGICWGADTGNQEKNYKRGLGCLSSEHGRTFEFPDVYMIIKGHSAKVIREWYTHIGGLPSRLQESTRYIDYQHGFDYVTPPSIAKNEEALLLYQSLMDAIKATMTALDSVGIPREDSSLCLPLGMESGLVCKHNLRNLMDMSRQRLCSRAYHEYRALFHELMDALRAYSEEWAYLVDHYFMPKCEYTGFCREERSCGRMPKKEVSR